MLLLVVGVSLSLSFFHAGNVKEEKLSQFTLIFARHKKKKYTRENEEEREREKDARRRNNGEMA
jgi:hypothetical protein